MSAIERYFTESIVVTRPTYTTNNFGERVAAYNTHLTILGYLRPMSGTERDLSARLNYFADWRMYCGPADIKETDRITARGQTFEIKFIAPRRAVHLEIDLRVIKTQ